MPGASRGTPNTEDYLLGRGRLFFAELGADGKPGPFRDLGNAPEFRISITTEKITHKSSREGTAFTDAEVVLSQEGTFNFQLDEFNHDNYALFTSGDKSSETNAAVAGLTMTITNAQAGRWYDLEDSSGNRAYGIDPSKLDLEISGPTSLVKDLDYLVDERFGRIFIIEDGDGDGATITVTLDANALAPDLNAVRGMTKTTVKGALKFISVNPANNGFEEEIQFWKCSLTADGDTSLIGDDWSNMPFSGTIERNTAYPDNRSITIRHPGPPKT